MMSGFIFSFGEKGNALRGVTFLSPNKKVTKEVGLGESAQASLRQFAPSPKNPSLNFSWF